MKASFQKIVTFAGIIMSVVVAILILFFSLTTHSGAPSLGISDKSGHFLAYGAFGFSLFFAFVRLPSESSKRDSGGMHFRTGYTRGFVFSYITGMCLGILVEIIQPYFGRSREFADGVADFFGLVIGTAAAYIVLHVLLALIGGHDARR